MKYTLLFLLLSFSATAQDGRITGVVTYFFNDAQGDKPDLGSSVYAINVADFDTTKVNDFWGYKNAEFLRVQANSKLYSKEERAASKKKLEDMNLATPAQFDTLSKSIFKSELAIKYHKKTVQSTVDGSGNYSLSVPAGRYVVMIISNNRQGSNYAEIGGKVYMTTVSVEAGKDKRVDQNFDMY